MSYAHITVLTANLASFVTGTIFSWSSPELFKLENPEETPFDRPISEEEKSWISCLFPLGAVFGPFIFGYLADQIGRKYTLLATGVVFATFYAMLAFGKLVSIFFLARFFLGVSLGGVFTVMPMYVGEIADDTNRGALGSIMNCFLCSGLTFAYSLGPYVSVMVFNLVIAVFPMVFLVLFFILGVESPQYLIKKGQHELAKVTLQKIRGPRVNITEELSMIQKKIKEDGEGNLMDIIRSRGLRKALGISVGLVIFQQFSGINAVLFYAQKIFEDAGSSLDPAVSSILIGGMQFVTSFLTPFVADRLGRKILLLVSAIGMIVSEVPLGIYCYLKDQGHNVDSISFLPIMCLIAYIITYNFGYGPLPWAVMGELFPTNVKSIASSITSAVCWFSGFLIAKYFESISNEIGMGPSFLILSGFCSLAVPFTIFIVIETKRKSLIEIQIALER